MSMIMELSLFPMDKGASVGAHVARAVGIVRESGLPHMLTPMGTCVEGEWDELMALAGACFQAVSEGSERVYLTIKADWRRGREGGLRGKLASVEKALAHGGEGA